MNSPDENSAQQALIERIGRLRRYVRDRTPARFRHLVSADDVLQELCIAAHAEFAAVRADRPDALDRWLMTLAKRKMVDTLRAIRCSKRGGTEAFVIDGKSRMTSLTTLFARLQSPRKSPSREVG